MAFLTEQVWHWVDCLSRQTHFVMEVRPGRIAGGADITDQLALLHAVAGGNRIGRKMTVTGLDFAAMLDLDVIAVTPEALGLGDDPVGRGLDRCAGRSRKVDPLVVAIAVVDRVITHPEGAGDP